MLKHINTTCTNCDAETFITQAIDKGGNLYFKLECTSCDYTDDVTTEKLLFFLADLYFTNKEV